MIYFFPTDNYVLRINGQVYGPPGSTTFIGNSNLVPISVFVSIPLSLQSSIANMIAN